MEPSASLASAGDLQARIATNLRRVHETIADAAHRAGKDPAAIRLVAVSKTMPLTVIEAAWRAGQAEFGENMVQDALAKIPSFQDRDLTWHFIGHLQSNKAKFIPGHFSWVHSIDSLALAQKLSQVCQRKGVRVNALVQINVSGEASKYGISPEELYSLMDKLLSLNLSGIRLRGLMTLGRFNAADDELRCCFAQLRDLRDGCQQRFGLSDLTELSMGMTQDYPLAIAEGATIVRIGTAIFGERAPKGV
jgi:pyridoxal phosphate enzyme (YggS family)